MLVRLTVGTSNQTKFVVELTVKVFFIHDIRICTIEYLSQFREPTFQAEHDEEQELSKSCDCCPSE